MLCMGILLINHPVHKKKKRDKDTKLRRREAEHVEMGAPLKNGVPAMLNGVRDERNVWR